jgi:hypothetical protein
MKNTRFAAYIMLVLAILLPVTSGCVTKPPIEQVSICTEVSKDGEPKTMVDTLPPDTGDIFCSVKLVSVSDKSKVKAEWYIVKSEDGQYTDYLIGKETIAAATPYVVFGFVRSDKLLPRGDYQVKLYFDDKFIQSASFKIKGEVSASTAVLSDAVMCTGINLLTDLPLDKVDTFPNDSSILYCSVKVTGAAFSTNIKARWTYLDGELEGIKNKIIYTANTKVEGREYINFSIGRAEGKAFPLGNYDVTFLIEDKEQASLKFKVADWTTIPGPFISEAKTFSYADEEKKKINVTGKFAASIKEVGFGARAYNVPANTELSVKWILVRSDDAIYADYPLKEDKAVIEGTTPIIASLKRGEKDMPKGDYAVKIALNGKDMVTLPFKVQ